MVKGLAEFSTHAIVFQRDRLEVSTDFGIHTRVVKVRECSRTAEHIRFRVVRWFHGNIGVAVQTGSGWNELTDDDVFFQTEQGVSLSLHGGLRQAASRLLEGCR